ncbi:hypothetical protein niasHT_019711 [Heterodera trifolii]|uniref:Uncharacterized protein n=1 Tax=Heterodera trifolii TaxID=157864 RepID=A0ABD2LCW6_9BILA
MIAYPRPPSVDNQIEDIRKALREMHRTIYKWHRATENATGAVNSPLNEVDAALNGIRNEVTNIRHSFIDTIGKFPSHFVWLFLLLLLSLLIWSVAFFLIIKIAEGMREIGRRRRILREDKNEQKFMEVGKRKKDIKNAIGKCHGQWSAEVTDGQSEQITGDTFFPKMPLISPPLQLSRGILKSAQKNHLNAERIDKTMPTPRRNSQFEDEERENEDEIRKALLPKAQQKTIYLP